MLHADQPGRAIDLFTEYLQLTVPDAAKVGQLLKQAKAEVARWRLGPTGAGVDAGPTFTQQSY